MENKKSQQILEEYSQNDMAKLKQISYKIFSKFGGISPKDYDDFYSIANFTLWNMTETFDETLGIPFHTYLIGGLTNKFKTEITRRNRKKQVPSDKLSYLDAPPEDGLSLQEKLPSDFNMEEEVLDNPNVMEYLENLPQKTRQIIEMKINGFPNEEIKNKMGLSNSEFNKYMDMAKSFTYTTVLFKNSDNKETENMEEKKMNEITTQTLEKSKPDKLSIASIIKKIDNCTIRFDHPLQRSSDQWNPTMRGNMISDILQNNPLPALVFAEQVINELAVIWDLDGKQRCTNAYSFKNDGYKISKNIRRWNISYQARVKENGCYKMDENGFPLIEKRVFDIRGKKFSQLPEELKDRFLEYNFEIVQYLNCSSEDIAYHIERYNDGRPMNASQKGITRLGEESAYMVKEISKMPFFKDLGGYRVSDENNGTIGRVIVESIMTTYFLDNWKKRQEDMCKYIRENATSTHFSGFMNMVDRLTEAGTEEVFNMFDSKDSFLYFGLFARFIESGLDDDRFISFMSALGKTLHKKEINGISYDSLNGKSTKDKYVVIAKINHLTELMTEYLNNGVDIAEDETVIDIVA